MLVFVQDAAEEVILERGLRPLGSLHPHRHRYGARQVSPTMSLFRAPSRPEVRPWR